jgi:hypothetical protein
MALNATSESVEPDLFDPAVSALESDAEIQDATASDDSAASSTAESPAAGATDTQSVTPPPGPETQQQGAPPTEEEDNPFEKIHAAMVETLGQEEADAWLAAKVKEAEPDAPKDEPSFVAPPLGFDINEYDTDEQLRIQAECDKFDACYQQTSKDIGKLSGELNAKIGEYTDTLSAHDENQAYIAELRSRMSQGDDVEREIRIAEKNATALAKAAQAQYAEIQKKTEEKQQQEVFKDRLDRIVSVSQRVPRLKERADDYVLAVLNGQINPDATIREQLVAFSTILLKQGKPSLGAKRAAKETSEAKEKRMANLKKLTTKFGGGKSGGARAASAPKSRETLPDDVREHLRGILN